MKLYKLLVVSLILAILTIGAVSAGDENVTDALTVSEDAAPDVSVDASLSECDEEISASSADDIELDSSNGSSSAKENPSIVVEMPEKVLTKSHDLMEVKCPDDWEWNNVTLYFDEKEYPYFHYGVVWFDDDFQEFMGDDYGVHAWKVNFSGDEKYNPASENGTFIYTYADFKLNNDTYDPFIVATPSLPKGADGNITFKVNGVEVYNEKFIDDDLNDDYANMRILINTKLEDFGVYEYEIAYTGDESRTGYAEMGMLSYHYRFDVDIDKEIRIGETSRLSVSLPEDVTGKVDITIDNVTETVNAQEYIDMDYNLTLFNHTVTVRYYSGNYPENSKSAYVYVREVWDYDETVFFDENAEVTLKLNEDAKGKITASENGKTIASATFSKGFANMTLPILKFGAHNITLQYAGSDYDINPVEYTLDVIPYVHVPYMMNYGEDEYIEIEYPDDAKGNVHISIYDELGFDYEDAIPIIEQIIPLENAKANYSLCEVAVNDDAGYLVAVSYNGNYPDFYEEYNMRVLRPIPKITCESIPELVVGQNATFIFSLPSDATGLLHVLIQTEPIWYEGPLGDSGSAYPKDGKATIVVTPHKAGTFYLNYYYHDIDEDSKYYSTQGGFEVTVKENGTAPSNETQNNTVVPQMTVPSLDNLSGEDSFEIILPDDATGTVTLTLNSQDHVFDVAGGRANVKLPELANGDYPYVLKYSGDGKYSSCAVNGTLRINAVSANQTENQTGGDSAENQTGGNTSDANSTEPEVDPVIKASNANVVYTAGTYYAITVYGTDGNLADGETVKVTGKISKTLTTTNGVAKFKVTQVPGTYKITISALGKSVSKTITVKHLVTLKTATVKKSAKKLTLQATLGKVNGKYLKSKKVTFKFNGKTYTAKTNAKGVAKVTIKSSVLKKLKVGKKVTYQATYLKDTVKKTVKVKK